MAAPRPPVLLGRAGERQALDRLLENVRGGQSAVLIVRGEAGVGKTALLRHCGRQASGFRVARIAGVESEMELPFAGLHQLCASDARASSTLSRRRSGPRSASRSACTSGAAADRLPGRVGRAEPARPRSPRSGRCCASSMTSQWLDARLERRCSGSSHDDCWPSRWRSSSRSVTRAMRASLAGLPELALGGLPDEDARALLATVIPGRLDERVRDRIVAETHGNPLAMLELPRALDPTQLAGGLGLGGAPRCPGGSRRASCDSSKRSPRTRGCCWSWRRPSRSATHCWCGARPSDSASRPRPAPTRTGLVAIGERVTFRHPLVRSTIYRSASPQERRAVHLALAEVTDAGRRRGPSCVASRRRGSGSGRGGRRWSSSGPPAGRRRAADSPRRPRSCSAPSR